MPLSGSTFYIPGKNICLAACTEGDLYVIETLKGHLVDEVFLEICSHKSHIVFFVSQEILTLL